MKKASTGRFGWVFVLLASGTLAASCNAILGIEGIHEDLGEEPRGFSGGASPGAGGAPSSTATSGSSMAITATGSSMPMSASGGGMSGSVSGPISSSVSGWPTTTSVSGSASTSTGISSCSDGVQDPGETDVDCGGETTDCARCDDCKKCMSPVDCKSSLCSGGLCRNSDMVTCVDAGLPMPVEAGLEAAADDGGLKPVEAGEIMVDGALP